MQDLLRWMPLRMNLQFFAADAGQGGGTDAAGGAQGQQGGQGNDAGTGTTQSGSGGDSGGQGGFQLTPELETWLQKQIQSAEDRVRTQYVKQLKQLEQQLQAKMTEEEKIQYELEKKRRELMEKEAALKRQTVELEATNLLAQTNLPIQFKPFVLGDDVDDTKRRIEDFKKLWDAAVSEEVTKRMAAGGRTPPGDGTGGKVGFNMNDLIRSAARR
ncbi:MAG: hypothetical protein BLM47_00125 [Candidatus Reconcilbacillus cellulovorans]|uniref:Uncharacterized protein n=1 Tax=Candidatus Reconcilbacillus cellulovorans TaxID=1906605 RepID=A0A2A6E3N0_9BACL|nr:MAG: hypothetical protein BLM47_00125 [Candidatus Reconcilbacillus cellulovorans]